MATIDILNSDGYLTIPLYHGTSRIFWDSIKTQGVGGRNVIKEWQALDLFTIAKTCDEATSRVQSIGIG